MAISTLYSRLSPSSKKKAHDLFAFFSQALARLILPFNRLFFIFSKKQKTCLHVGSGHIRLKGWINSDFHPKAEFILDIRKRLPFSDNSLERIYSEHVIEHLTQEQGLAFLKEAHRTLSSTGVIRIAMPNLEDIVDAYTNNWRGLDWVNWPGHEFISTKAEMLNIAFRWWGHQYLYDQEELERRLKEAGFNSIEFKSKGESEHTDLCNLENREDSTLIAEATK